MPGRSAGYGQWQKSTTILLLAPALWLTAACGGGDKQAARADRKVAAATSSPEAPARDFCTLLTNQEVEGAVGWKVTGAKSTGRGDYGSCTYTGRTDPMVLPPEKVEAGIIYCVTNMPCYEDLPDFHSSAEFAAYRVKRYGDGKQGAFENVHPAVVALDGFGVPAIDHELAGMRSIEMQIGHKRVAYVSIWGEAGPARDLAQKLLARAR